MTTSIRYEPPALELSIAPDTSPSAGAAPAAGSIDRAAVGILGAMISLIIVLTVVLLGLSPAAQPSGVARGDDGGVTSAAVPASKS